MDNNKDKSKLEKFGSRHPSKLGSSLTCSHWSELGFSKLVPHGDYNAGRAENEDEDEVGDLGLQSAVETVVQPGHEGSHSQQRDTTIIQPGGEEGKVRVRTVSGGQRTHSTYHPLITITIVAAFAMSCSKTKLFIIYPCGFFRIKMILVPYTITGSKKTTFSFFPQFQLI